MAGVGDGDEEAGDGEREGMKDALFAVPCWGERPAGGGGGGAKRQGSQGMGRARGFTTVCLPSVLRGGCIGWQGALR
jgi:hypothetical protein